MRRCHRRNMAKKLKLTADEVEARQWALVGARLLPGTCRARYTAAVARPHYPAKAWQELSDRLDACARRVRDLAAERTGAERLGRSRVATALAEMSREAWRRGVG